MTYRWPSLFADFLTVKSLIHISKLVRIDNVLVKKWIFYLRNSGFTVQNDGTYVPRITRETCTCFQNFECISFVVLLVSSSHRSSASSEQTNNIDIHFTPWHFTFKKIWERFNKLISFISFVTRVFRDLLKKNNQYRVYRVC